MKIRITPKTQIVIGRYDCTCGQTFATLAKAVEHGLKCSGHFK